MTLEKVPTNHSTNSRQSRRNSHKPTRSQTSQSVGDTSATEPDPLSGHLNHLSREQSEALETFKKECAEQKLYIPGGVTEEEKGKDKEVGGQKASHDDATLLRFLRARKFDVNGALDQFKSTEEWRKENQIEDLYENFDVDSYEESRRVYPQWTGRRDRRGIPIYVFVIKNLNSKNMAAYSSGTASKLTSATHTSSKVPPRLLRLFALYENMTRFVLPLCSRLERPNPETPIVSTTNIVDISGVGLKQFWNLKGHMQDASVLATAHYPETLDRIFIIGAPAFFPTVWNWIKRWFDPVTTSKIFILSAAEVEPTLKSFMDPSDFPKQYGGQLDWQWGDMPNMDKPASAVAGPLEHIGEMGDATGPTIDEKGTFVKGPVVCYDDRIEVLGSVNGKPRRRSIPSALVGDAAKNLEASSPEVNGATETTSSPNCDKEKAALDTTKAEAHGSPVTEQAVSAS